MTHDDVCKLPDLPEVSVEPSGSVSPPSLAETLLRRIDETWGRPDCPTDWIEMPSQRRWEYETAVRLLDVSAGARVLDAGGGCGYLSYILSGGYDVTFNDRHDTYCQPPAPVRKIIGSFFTLLEERPFDAIACVSVLEHVLPEQRAAWFDKTCRLLKPGGVAVFTFEWHPTEVFDIKDGLTLTAQQLIDLCDSELFRVVAQMKSPVRASNSRGWTPVAVKIVRSED